MNNSQSVFFVGLMLVLASCQYELHPSYTHIYKDKDHSRVFEVNLDTSQTSFSLLIENSWGGLDLFGSYLRCKNKLFLIPYPGKFFREEIVENDSIYSFNVFDRATGDSLLLFYLIEGEPLPDSLVIGYEAILVGEQFGKYITIHSLGYEPFSFKLERYGKYNVFLYNGNYNKGLLLWKIKKKSLYSEGLELRASPSSSN